MSIWQSGALHDRCRCIYIYCFICSHSEWFYRGLHLCMSVCVYLSVSEQLLNKIQVWTKMHFTGVLIQTNWVVIHWYLTLFEVHWIYRTILPFENSWCRSAFHPLLSVLFKHWINPKQATVVRLADISHVSFKNRAQLP